MTQESQLVVQPVRKLANCMIVLGPDQQIGLFVPLSQDATALMPALRELPCRVDKPDDIPATSSVAAAVGVSQDVKQASTTTQCENLPKRHTGRKLSDANYVSALADQVNSALHGPNISKQMWTCVSDGNHWTLTWNADYRSRIEFSLDDDGSCDVWRKWKPVHGCSFKDQPIRAGDVEDSTAKVLAWADQGPHNWHEHRLPITPELRKKLILRRDARRARIAARRARINARKPAPL